MYYHEHVCYTNGSIVSENPLVINLVYFFKHYSQLLAASTRSKAML
jgi:hypothetical protein